MHILDEIQPFLLRLVSNTVLQQIAPLIVILLIPTLVFAAQSYKHILVHPILMVLETVALILPWNWFSGSGNVSQERRKLKKKHVRTRAEQLAIAGDVSASEMSSFENEGYYPGIVNISGTYCFMDSTLQAMASLSYLQPHIEEIHAKAEALDVPTPVIDALRDLLLKLNNPKSSPSAIRPIDMIEALSRHSPGRQNALFASREHQDAQELFQLLSECIKKETAAVDKEGYRDRGLGGLNGHPPRTAREIGKSVFDGLTANRRSCVECGYTEAVMHFAFDNWQLAVPRVAGACRLEECLEDYTRLEYLNDCICRKCSMVATYRRLAYEAEKLTESAAGHESSASKKRRAREARKLEARVKSALDEGRIEEDLKDIKMEKVFSRASTKQAMVARPPPILALHLNRSVHYGHYAAKNTCRVFFPEFLDLTPYTTSGQLSTAPVSPISTPPPSTPRSTTPTPSTYSATRTLYRLSSVVCHYGQHSYGHYVCYRRKPRPVSSGPRRFTPPKLACPFGCECKKCERHGPIRDEEDESSPRNSPGRGWLRISDDSVSECGIETVLQEGSGVFMLYYERVVLPGLVLSTSPRSSEETLRPAATTNGSTSSHSTVGPLKLEEGPRKPGSSGAYGPRIVRNVSTQRSRGGSAAPSSPSSRGSAPAASENSKNGGTAPRGTTPRANGHASHPRELSPPRHASPSKLPASPASPKADSRPSPVRRPSSSDPRVSSSTSPTSRHTRQPPPARVRSPQPVRTSTRPLSPVRTVGLRA